MELSQEMIREQKEKMLKGLQKQINSTNNEINLYKNQALYEEKIRLKHLQEEEEIDRLMNKSKQLEKQRDLLEAWERDAHVKNLQKLVGKEKGSDAVKLYITNTGLVSPSTGEYHTSDDVYIASSLASVGGSGSSREDQKGNEQLRGTFRLNDSAIGFDTRRK
jgi:hypothetical protein